MLPEDLNIVEVNEHGPSLTYEIDFINNKVKNKIDGIEAVKQAVFLVLIIEEDYSEIYHDYGLKIDDLIGKDTGLILSELKRRITESLLRDDRIISVDNFSFQQLNDGLLTKFDVSSIFGEFASEGVFNI